ncbi:MAG: hypothetical protein HYR85_24810 [Planctomycetes bacterium]|nr:hypothetical protein [Planctomycetota bacterium]
MVGYRFHPPDPNREAPFLPEVEAGRFRFQHWQNVGAGAGAEVALRLEAWKFISETDRL